LFKVNEYYNGNVKSLGFKTPEGPATVGVMAKGEYEFGTSSREIVTVIAGQLAVKLPGSKVWNDIGANQTFTVEANEKFQLKVEEDTAYICLYR
jgi:uncharacterized protein YaiE (UPF0345 family)